MSGENNRDKMAGNARHGLPPTAKMTVHPMVRQRPQLWEGLCGKPVGEQYN